MFILDSKTRVGLVDTHAAGDGHGVNYWPYVAMYMLPYYSLSRIIIHYTLCMHHIINSAQNPSQNVLLGLVVAWPIGLCISWTWPLFNILWSLDKKKSHKTQTQKKKVINWFVSLLVLDCFLQVTLHSAPLLLSHTF